MVDWKSPHLKSLSGAISSSISEESLSVLAAEALRELPTKKVSSVLNILCSVYCRDSAGLIDASLLESKGNSSHSLICGVAFQKGDIVWTCKQCGKDDTCVQCDDCFRSSDHTNHEVFFHRASSSGGCCDCGDVEAWAACGVCRTHSAAAAKAHDTQQMNPVDALPGNLRKGLSAVLRGVLGVVATYSIACGRSCQQWGENEYTSTHALHADEALCGRLMNDDIHSYDEVTDALKECGLSSSKSEALTLSVDVNGEALLRDPGIGSGSLSRHESDWKALAQTAGLVYSIVPRRVYMLTPNITHALRWMIQLSSQPKMNDCHDGCRRLVAISLNAAIEEFPPLVSVMVGSNGSVPPVRSFPPAAVFTNDKLFPQSIPYLSSQTMNRLPKTTLPHTCLAMLLLSSPFLSKHIKLAINELILVYQHDTMFKSLFVQTFVLVYPIVNALYCHSIGTEKETLLHSSVQVFTSDSAVSLMSSNGVPLRLLQETTETPVFIAKLIVETIYFALIEVGCHKERNVVMNGVATSFLEHHSMVNNRLFHLFRDFEYVTTNPTMALDTLCGVQDPGVLDDWLKMCYMLQQLDAVKRKTGTHQEYETSRWHIALNLMLEIDSTFSHFVSNALFPTLSFYEQQANSSSTDGSTDRTSDVTKKAIAVSQATVKTLEAMGKHFLSTKVECGPPCKVKVLDVEVFCEHGFALKQDRCISIGYVSVNIPLQKCFSKIMYFACAANLDLSFFPSLCKDYYCGLMGLLEFSMQAIGFCSMVSCSMWRRNGMSVAQIGHNYVVSPLSKVLRDSDLLSIQSATLALGPDSTIALALFRFELAKYLETETDTTALAGFRKPMLAECLRFFIHLTTYIPVVLAEDDKRDSCADVPCHDRKEGLFGALRREMTNYILAGKNTMGKLQIAKKMFGSHNTVNDEHLRSVVTDVCLPNASEKATLFMLKPQKIVDYFDPEHYHLSNKELVKNLDVVRENRKKADDVKTLKKVQPRRPMLSPMAMPVGHTQFEDVRLILFRPLFISMLLKSIKSCKTSKDESDKGATFVILKRVVHLVTLQLHCSQYTVGDNKKRKLNAPSDYRFHWIGIDWFFNKSFDAFIEGSTLSSTSGGSSSADSPSACVNSAEEYNGTDVDISSREDDRSDKEGEDQLNEKLSTTCGLFRQLLLALADIWLVGSPLREQDAYYWEGLEWILQEMGERSSVALNLLAEKGIAFASSAAIAEENRKIALIRRKAAQDRAMKKLSKQASAFAASANYEALDDDSENVVSDIGNETDLPKKPVVVSCEDGAEVCIFCHERNDSPIGYLGFLQPSTFIHHAIHTQTTSDCRSLDFVYRVVSVAGCQIYSQPLEEDTYRIGNLSQSDHVEGVRKYGRWVEISSPIMGWCPMYSSPKVAREVELDIVVNECSRSKDSVAYLYPVKHLQYSQHGQTRLHASHCGHTMHYHCFDTFLATCLAAAWRSQDEAVNVDAGEVLCPLCKGIANVLLPHYPEHCTEHRWPSVLPSQQPDQWNGNSERLDQSLKTVELCYPKLPTSESITKGCCTILSKPERDAKTTGDMLKLSNKPHQLAEACVRYGKVPVNFCPSRSWEQDHFGKDLYGTQLCHALWSSTAYTLQSALVVDRWQFHLSDATNSATTSTSTDVPDLNCRKQFAILKSLLYSSCYAANWFESVETFMTSIVKPLNRLLIGYSVDTGRLSEGCRVLDLNTVTIPELKGAYNTLPTHVVNDAAFPDPWRVAHIIEKAGLMFEKISAEDERDEILGVWPLLLKPLLAQDLAVMAVGCLVAGYVTDLQAEAESVCGSTPSSNLFSLVATSEILNILCLARLSQVLLEPLATGLVDESNTCSQFCSDPFPVEVESADAGSLTGDLRALQVVICSAAFVEVDVKFSPSPEKLLSAVCDSWIPYLQYILVLKHIMKLNSMSSSPDVYQDREEKLYSLLMVSTSTSTVSSVNMLLAALELPSFQELVGVHGSDVSTLCQRWATAYHHSHPTTHVPTLTSGAPGAVVSRWIPQKAVVSHATSSSTSDSTAGADTSVPSATANQIMGIIPEYTTIDEVLGGLFKRPRGADAITCLHSCSPLQGSLTGTSAVYGVNGETLDFVFPDLSHFGLGLRHKAGLISLPYMFTDIYQQTKFPFGRDKRCLAEPALCLVCGCILNGGKQLGAGETMVDHGAGECTTHAKTCGFGTGVFLLVQQCCPLIIRHRRSCYLPPIYLDANGEVDSRGVDRRNRPLFLHRQRYEQLEGMYARHLVGREVSRIRLNANSVIRQNWF